MRLGACQRAVIPRARSRLGNPGVPFLQLTLEIRVLHVQSTRLMKHSRHGRFVSPSRTARLVVGDRIEPFNPFAQFADCLQDLNMHCRIAGPAAFVQPLPQRSAVNRYDISSRLPQRACRAAGVHALHLEVERDKRRAIDFYRRAGFEDHDRYLMTKRIRE